MMSRHKPQWGSRLKVWITISLGSNKLGIECPTCHNKAIVSKSLWGKPVGAIKKGSKTRPCTYCFATAWISQKAKDKFNARTYGDE
jgi:hypothetical protein